MLETAADLVEKRFRGVYNVEWFVSSRLLHVLRRARKHHIVIYFETSHTSGANFEPRISHLWPDIFKLLNLL